MDKLLNLGVVASVTVFVLVVVVCCLGPVGMFRGMRMTVLVNAVCMVVLMALLEFQRITFGRTSLIQIQNCLKLVRLRQLFCCFEVIRIFLEAKSLPSAIRTQGLQSNHISANRRDGLSLSI